MDRDQGRELHRGGDHVVTRLALIDVVVWMDWLPRSPRLAEDLVRPVGDHFVGIRIRRCPRAGLEDVDDEILVELAYLDFLGRLLNRVGEASLEQP